MSLDMSDFMDDTFESFEVIRISEVAGGRDPVSGIWVDGTLVETPHSVNAQPATDREIDFLSQGGERIGDTRNLWINDGILTSIQEADLWEFEGQKWRCLKMDNRPKRNYCKVTVTRLDVQS